MAGDKPAGKVIPFTSSTGKGGGHERNPFLHKMAERVLKPALITAAVIVINVGVLQSASAKLSAKKAGGGDIVLQSDTLAIRPSIKSKPLPPATHAEIQAVLSKISHTYPDVLKAWATRRQLDLGAELKPLELNLELVNAAKFDSLEYTGRSVIFDPDAQTIYINGAVPLDKGELSFALCATFASYGGFGEVTPFHEMGLVPSLMTYKLSPSDSPKPLPDGEPPAVLRDRQAVALWFAQFVGIEKFVNAYASGDISLLRRTYDQKFGAGSYDELMALVYQWKGPGYPLPDPATIMKTISKHIRQSGGKGSAWDQVEPLAKGLGYKVQPVP